MIRIGGMSRNEDYGFLFSDRRLLESYVSRCAMPSVDFQALRSQVSIGQVLDLLGFVAVEVSGDQVRGGCPIHGSSSPESRSFSAHLKANTYRCFKCGSQGNQLDLWVAATKQPLYEAAIDLCNELTIDIPKR